LKFFDPRRFSPIRIVSPEGGKGVILKGDAPPRVGWRGAGRGRGSAGAPLRRLERQLLFF